MHLLVIIVTEQLCYSGVALQEYHMINNVTLHLRYQRTGMYIMS